MRLEASAIPSPRRGKIFCAGEHFAPVQTSLEANTGHSRRAEAVAYPQRTLTTQGGRHCKSERR